MPLALLVGTSFLCAITSPAPAATVTQGTPVTITGTLTGAAVTVQVKLGLAVLGSASIVGLTWSYSWTPQSGDVGPQTINAIATSTGGIQAIADGVAVTVASSIALGDFGALATSKGLTVRGFQRGDLGLSGTTGSGKSVWANQLGANGNIVVPTSGAANGVGTPGAGLNGHASLVQDGSTQGGKFTCAAQAAPATTNRHKYWIGRLLAIPGAAGYLSHADSGGQFDGSGDQIAIVGGGDANYRWGAAASAPPNTTGRVANTWYRVRHSINGGGNDFLRVGNNETAHVASGLGACALTVVNFGCFNDIGQLKASYEWLLYLDLEGPNAAMSSFATDADAMAQTFWTNAIEV